MSQSAEEKQNSSYRQPFDLSKPVFPNLLKVQKGEKDFSSKLLIQQPFSRGQTICEMKGFEIVEKAWTTVQIASDKHIELNSELVFMNHSCNPSVRLDCSALSLIALRDLVPGDEITFFYPSTEWEMSQPFECWCGHPSCSKLIKGSKYLDRDHPLLEPHIKSMFNKS